MSGHYPSSSHRNNTSHQYLNKSLKKSQSKKHYHQQSMDDFIKNIKKYNLRSQRYISSKPILYMYGKNNTTTTIQKDRSRTLSNHKSRSKSKKIKKKIANIFQDGQSPIKISNKRSHSKFSKKKQFQNPGELIQQFSGKIGKVAKYLQKRNQIGSYICHKFQQMLNQIVSKLVIHLDYQIQQIQTKSIKTIKQKYQHKLRNTQLYSNKLQNKLKDALIKLQNNANLIYQIRLLSNIDIEYLYGSKLLNTNKCGGYGYNNNRNNQMERSSQYSQYQNNIYQQIQYKSQQQQIMYKKNKRQEQQFIISNRKQQKVNLRNFHHKQFDDIDLQEQIFDSGRIREVSKWQKDYQLQDEDHDKWEQIRNRST